jgi:hypothetical protein
MNALAGTFLAALVLAVPAWAAEAMPRGNAPVVIVAPVDTAWEVPLREVRLRPEADGPEWVLDVRNASLPREVLRRGLAPGDWLRAHGRRIAPEHIQVTRLEVIPAAEYGSVMAVAGERLEQQPLRLNGTVFLVQPRKGKLIVLDQSNRRHLVREETAVVVRRGGTRPVALARLRPGDDVIIRGEVDPF